MDSGELTTEILKAELPNIAYHDIVALRAKVTQYPIPWNVFSADPICYLLNHSDCDGSISYKHALPLAKRLQEIKPKMSDYWASRVQQFADGLRTAHAAKENVEFH
jgi:hypothetical protein